MASAGTLRAIWVKRFHLGPMDPVATAELVAARGLVGNADQGRRRQVTVISEEVWEEVTRELGVAVDPRSRRANLMVRGLDLTASRGRVLQLGACAVRILGETRPCPRMDEAHPGLMAALAHPWRGGAFGEVLVGGAIAVGDGAGWRAEAAGDEPGLDAPGSAGGGERPRDAPGRGSPPAHEPSGT